MVALSQPSVALSRIYRERKSSRCDLLGADSAGLQSVWIGLSAA